MCTIKSSIKDDYIPLDKRFIAGADIEIEGVNYFIKDVQKVKGTIYLILDAPIELIKCNISFDLGDDNV